MGATHNWKTSHEQTREQRGWEVETQRGKGSKEIVRYMTVKRQRHIMRVTPLDTHTAAPRYAHPSISAA